MDLILLLLDVAFLLAITPSACLLFTGCLLGTIVLIVGKAKENDR